MSLHRGAGLGAGALAGASVFVDFDGTISRVDTALHLLERLAPDAAWPEVERRYDAGEIGSRECMELEWAMLPHDRRLIETTVSEVEDDPSTAELFTLLRAAGAEVTIVSDGFGISAHAVGADLGVRVVCNRVDWATWRLEFGGASPGCPCSGCGTCKRAPIEEARRRGRTTVLIGDGTSDRHAALLADVVFAKDGLAAWCGANGVEHQPWSTLADVIAALGL